MLMRIAAYVPELTKEEVERFWLTPVQLCQLAAVGEATDPKVKKLLNTLSDRGHVPFVKSGVAKTSPRLYSLVSAAMLRTIWDITRDGRTYRYAQPVADAIRKTICKVVQEIPDLGEFDDHLGNARIVFSGMSDEGTPEQIRWAKGEVSGKFDLAYSVFDGGYLIFKVLDTYADFWHGDLVACGEIDPPAPMQVGEDGWSLDEGGD